MKLICAGLSNNVDHRVAAKSDFGCIGILLNLELLYRVHRRRIQRSSYPAVVFLVCLTNPIHNNVGCRVPAAVGDEVSSARVQAEGSARGLCHAGDSAAKLYTERLVSGRSLINF